MSSSRTSIGAYDILGELGRGGMAVVYHAYDRVHQRPVALKVLLRHQQHNTEVLRRFLREGHAQMELRHPNIVHTYDAGQVGGTYYIAMEYLPGGSLAHRLRQQGRPLDLATAASIVAQIAAALDYAHSRGVLHRDLKPSNILFDGRGRAVLTDFGVAKVAGDTHLTQESAILGTAAYMSPEQARGLGGLDHRTDIYSLGVILYEMLTGRPPFQGEHEVVILHKVLHEAPPPPRAFNRSIPPAVEQVILTALQKDRNRRYSTAGQMAAALQAALAATRTRPSRQPRAVPGNSQKRSAPGVPRRTLWPYVLAGFALIMLAMVWITVSSRPGSSAPLSAPPAVSSPTAPVNPPVPVQVRGQVVQESYLYRTPSDQHSPIFRLPVGTEVTIVTADVPGSLVQGTDRWHRVRVVYQGRNVEGYLPAGVVRVER